MITILDGQAQGVELSLARAPLYLRVTHADKAKGNRAGASGWDGLDQMTDEPHPNETIYAYRRVEASPNFIHIDFTRKKSAWVAIASYRLAPCQPEDSVMRSTSSWREWCYDRVLDASPADLHPDRQAFIEKIKDHPEEDSCRVVFADWLEENGDPERAEFIRVQCKLAQCDEKYCETCRLGRTSRNLKLPPACTCDGGLRKLRQREMDLLANGMPCKGQPLTPRPGWVGIDPRKCRKVNNNGSFTDKVSWSFRRGFLDSIRIHPIDWFQNAPILRAGHPLRKVDLMDYPGAWHVGYDWILKYHNAGNVHKTWVKLLSEEFPGITFTITPKNI